MDVVQLLEHEVTTYGVVIGHPGVVDPELPAIWVKKD